MTSKADYLPALDGLRAISILLVIFSHAWMGHLVPGGLGVTTFFFISGFIITRTLLVENDRNGTIGVRAFYLRRFFRLIPALLVFVLVSAVLIAMLDGHVPWLDMLAALFYYSNYWDIAGYFHEGVLLSPFSITWSLAVEEHYYLVFPFVFLLMVRLPFRWTLVGLISVCMVVLVWRGILYGELATVATETYRIYKATDTRVDSIVYGVIASWLIWYRPCLLKGWGHGAWTAFGLALLLFCLAYRDQAFREVERYSLQGLALLMIFPWTVLKNTWGSRLLSHRLLLYIGKISYSLYLYHWLVFVLVDHYAAYLPLPIRIVLMLFASFVLADLSWRLVERAGHGLRKRFLPTPRKEPLSQSVVR